jgi:hypothetical protein
VLEHRLDALDGEIARVIAENPAAVERALLVQTVFGIGPGVAATLTADLPELGLLSGKEIAALVGLAPHPQKSGKTRHRETAGDGRPGVRQALFNAARAALRHPNPFRDFYDRLVQNGRPGKVALTAVMRKILVTANAVIRDRQPWRGGGAGRPAPEAVGILCRPHAKPRAHRAGRVKAAAAPGASLDAAGAMGNPPNAPHFYVDLVHGRCPLARE